MRGAPSYEKKACKYCHETIGSNAIGKHESLCKSSTPEEREQRKKYRLGNRKYKMASARLPVRAEGKPAQRVYQNGSHPIAFPFSNQSFVITISVNWHVEQAAP